jgi:imidazolonepropionase-like amidohydrolase
MADTVITGAAVWDGEAEAPAEPCEVLVSDGRISAVDAEVARPDGAQVIELGGHTVLPGLIDCHVHATLAPERLLMVAAESPGSKILNSLEPLRAMLRNGFTTVRDVGAIDAEFITVDLRAAQARGLIAAPRMVVAPHLLSSTGGHGDISALLSRQYAADCQLLEFELADGPEGVRKRVRDEVRRGADWIKFASTGGFATPSDDPGQVTFTQEEMDALVATAADLGVPVCTHAYGDEGVRRATLAGVRSVEHASLVSAETMEMIVDRGVWVVPTQSAIVVAARSVDDDDFWVGQPETKRAKYRAHAAEILAAAEVVASSEAMVAYGTDAGVRPHADNWREFPALVENGISELRALRAATSVAADLLDLPEAGRLAPGNWADVVAVPGDPFGEIDCMGEVDFVMQAGVVHERP